MGHFDVLGLNFPLLFARNKYLFLIVEHVHGNVWGEISAEGNFSLSPGDSGLLRKEFPCRPVH